MTDTPTPQPRKPRLRVLRWAGRSVSFLIVLSIFVALGAALYMRGKPVVAPDWVQERIEARIAEVLPEAQVSFGDMVFVVEDDWRPRVLLRNIVVRSLAGAEIVRFNEFKAALAARPLLERQVQPQSISLSGVVARLRRGADGSFALSGVAGGAGPEQQAATLPDLVGQLDTILQRPALSALRTAELRALTLRYEDAGTGRVWTVDGGRMVLDRDGAALSVSADLAVLAGGTGVATLAANYTTQIGQTAAQFGVSFDDVPAQDIAAQGPAFEWLGVLRAPISGSVRSGLTAEGRFEPLNATLQIGKGAVQPNAATLPIPFDGARSYFSYIPAEKLLRFDELSVRSAWLTGQATGSAVLGIEGNQGPLQDLVGQIELTDLVANPMELYPEPLSLARADVDFRMELNPFRLTIGRLQVSDQGNTLLMDGTIRAEQNGWRLAMDGQMDSIAPDRLLTFWPEQASTKTRNWLLQNLHSGVIRNVDLALRRSPDAPPQTYVAYDFADASVKFMKTMPPITDAKGHFSLADDRLVITVDEGQVTADEGGALDMTGSSFIIPDVRVKPDTPSVIRLQTRSSVTAALSLLNRPPLSVMDKAKRPVTLANGTAVMTGTIATPLKKKRKPGDTQFFMRGDLLGLRSDALVKDRIVTADQLAFQADNSALVISGQGALDGVAFDGTWTQPIGPGADKSELTGDIALTAQALDTFGIALPDGSVSGAGEGEIALQFQRARAPRFSLSSDLRGIRVAVPQVNWLKGAGQQGRLYVSGALGDTPRIDRLEVAGPGLNAQGSVALSDGGLLERVRFDQLRVGDWLNVPLDLVGRGRGNPVQVVLRGGSLDMRRAEFGESGPRRGPPSPPMQVALNRLQISDTIALTDMQGEFQTGQGLAGTFRARVNGGTVVQGELVPQNGRSAVKLTAVDAGGVLRSADLLQQVVGGTLSLNLLPVGSGGAFDGQLTIRDTRIKDAPGIAALLNAVSVVGLINELNGDGIYFDTVEGRFRLTPNQLTLTQGSAVGASMGLSMDGIYSLGSNQIAMQGVITPVYLLNGIGSVLTRKGEGLFGFNYTLRGPAKKPSVGVNPLSALTPAMFREIFRAPPPDLPEVEGITESTLPDAPPEAKTPVAEQYEGR